jgi:hypothetical protein
MAKQKLKRHATPEELAEQHYFGPHTRITRADVLKMFGKSPRRPIIGKTFKRNGLRLGWNCQRIPYANVLTILHLKARNSGFNPNVYGTTSGFSIHYYFLRKYYVEV